ncbi:hypothetical protein [Candidatus Bodocaedibacter vickermanii]|uniref:Uncharacterized protein n=1 Tax=Candidatus Bodocaedibacter vickermanii TaxID=2741701 RepID=A0A7L9RT81_9PROT|nr:hypothetical protein CPBP_00517 [Candidatus Paracaedibacteraceae bacterium 'Lake Konstanz']
MILTPNPHHRSRKSRVVLTSLAKKLEPETLEKVDSQKIKPSTPNFKKPFIALKFFWQQKYISLDDYVTACKYVELSELVQKAMGCPNGFGRKVAWNQPFETSRVSWIQSELSLINQDYGRHCNDEELLTLWKVLQKALNKMPLSFRTKFNELLFAESISNFHMQERIYLKAFQHAIPAIKVFLLEFWKQKNPR